MPRPAIFETPNHLWYPQPLNLTEPAHQHRRDWHRLDLFGSSGKKFATLYGERADELRQRGTRWPAAVGLKLNPRFTPISV